MYPIPQQGHCIPQIHRRHENGDLQAPLFSLEVRSWYLLLDAPRVSPAHGMSETHDSLDARSIFVSNEGLYCQQRGKPVLDLWR